MITVTKIFMFEASHHLPHYEGACHNLHGHSYKLEVTVGGDVKTNTSNPKCGMIIDFKDLKEIVKEVAVDKYDHAYLNDFFPNPTAEIMVQQIAEDIMDRLSADLYLVSCKLWETTTSYAEYHALTQEVFIMLSALKKLFYKYFDYVIIGEYYDTSDGHYYHKKYHRKYYLKCLKRKRGGRK